MLDHEREAVANVVIATFGDLLRDKTGDTLFGDRPKQRVVEMKLIPRDRCLVLSLTDRK